jgi:hypothetical protein
MKRRTLLLGAGTVVVAGAIAGWRALTSSAESAVAKVLHKRLDYLHLDPDGVAQFARDIAARQDISGGRLRAIDAAGFLYTLPGFDGTDRVSLTVRHGEERVTSAYLISTDFFANGADESRTVRYLGLYDPRRPCNNPFARPVGSAG